MWHRFFKLIYLILLIGILLFTCVYYIKDFIRQERIYTEYKVKCIDNGKYIVLEGSENLAPLVTSMASFDLETTRKEYNFYCKFYDEMQPYIMKSFERKLTAQDITNYFYFRTEKIKQISNYPELFILEKQPHNKDYYYYYVIVNPLLDALINIGGLFILSQFLKNFYTYIKFGEVTFHPFRSKRRVD